MPGSCTSDRLNVGPIVAPAPVTPVAPSIAKSDSLPEPDFDAIVRAFKTRLADYHLPNEVINAYATTFYHCGNLGVEDHVLGSQNLQGIDKLGVIVVEDRSVAGEEPHVLTGLVGERPVSRADLTCPPLSLLRVRRRTTISCNDPTQYGTLRHDWRGIER